MSDHAELYFLIALALAAVLVASVWYHRPALRIPIAAIVVFAVVALLVHGQRRKAKIQKSIERVRQQVREREIAAELRK